MCGSCWASGRGLLTRRGERAHRGSFPRGRTTRARKPDAGLWGLLQMAEIIPTSRCRPRSLPWCPGRTAAIPGGHVQAISVSARAAPTLPLSCGYWEEQWSVVRQRSRSRYHRMRLSRRFPSWCVLSGRVSGARSERAERCRRSPAWRFPFQDYQSVRIDASDQCPGRIRTCAHGSGGQCCMTILRGKTRCSRPVGERMGGRMRTAGPGCSHIFDQPQRRRARIVVSSVVGYS